MKKPLLIVGKPHSSKTTFIVQFYSRLQKNKSKLSLYKAVENISQIKDAREALAKGEEAKPTSTDRNVELLLPIQFGEHQVDLYYPDYGGEQINTMITTRKIDKRWIDSIKESNNWILFIRLTNLNVAFDLSNKAFTSEQMKKNNEGKAEVYSISDQSALIEFLQIILNLKSHDYHFRNSEVKLTVVLTCWDELNTNDTPKHVLLNHLPLLLNFIETNWIENKIRIIGLSAQGFSLSEPENKELYQTEGPENFGYLIKPDGTKINDITELISEAL